VRQTVLLPAAIARCLSGANCVSYPALGEPSKLSRANPGPRCFACQKQRVDVEVEEAATELKAAEHRQMEEPGPSEDPEPEANRASMILERRRASVRTCERGLRSAIASKDARLARVVEIAARGAGPTAVGRRGSRVIREWRAVGAEALGNEPTDDRDYEP
jgi:hypothetical protein